VLRDRPDRAIDLMHRVADAVASALQRQVDWGLSGVRDGQYSLDLSADAAALATLAEAGVGVLSEESGIGSGEDGMVMIIDPVDGSTNCSRGVPWYATAMCLLQDGEPIAAMVVNQANGVRYEAIRGAGARRDGVPIRVSTCGAPSAAIIAHNGVPARPLGVQQSRMFGAAALDIGLVADGTLDGYIDCVNDAHGVWDYAASALILREAGGMVVDLHGRDLIVVDHRARRTPVAAATPALLDALLDIRRSFSD
jgi:fructose-1,6-bisphosphatase/inositol monophosphatase family enzyme